MSAWHEFVKDIGSDAIAKWSGGGGILLTLASLAFPTLFGTPWPFIWLGIACFFTSCVRGWFVAYSRLLPAFDIAMDILWSEGRAKHRIIVRNTGIEPITDVHVLATNVRPTPKELRPVGPSTSGEIVLYHDVPVWFEFVHRERAASEASFRVQVLDGQEIVMTTPYYLFQLAVVGRGVATAWYASDFNASDPDMVMGQPVRIASAGARIVKGRAQMKYELSND